MRFILAPLACFAILSTITPAIADPNLAALAKGGRWSSSSHKCVETTVSDVGYRLSGDKTSGSAVSFHTALGSNGIAGYHARGQVTEDTDPLIAAERAGDKVQVCLVSIPAAGNGCNPKRDDQGRVYRVYDYRQKVAYAGYNSSHLFPAGGA